MTTSIPNSFNPEELEKLMENAPQEQETISSDTEDYSPDRIHPIVEDALNQMAELSPGPLVHKVAALAIVERMYEWHNTMGMKMMEDGDTKAAMCWLRDAGHLQVIFNTLREISVGREDFTLPDED